MFHFIYCLAKFKDCLFTRLADVPLKSGQIVEAELALLGPEVPIYLEALKILCSD